jgi:uncharacterized membrane protein YccC
MSRGMFLFWIAVAAMLIISAMDATARQSGKFDKMIGTAVCSVLLYIVVAVAIKAGWIVLC